MMAKLSTKYSLSERYTNHSIRVTSLQVLEDNNVEGRHAIRVSGHKNTDSINSYARRLSASRKRSISNVIFKHLSGTKPNFKLLPDELAATEERAQLNKLIRTNQYPTPAQAVTDCSLVGHLNDENIFENIPIQMLNGIGGSTVPPIPTFHPIFSNCSNCTINLNVYQTKH